MIDAFLVSFDVIGLAELGDKSQLLTLASPRTILPTQALQIAASLGSL